MPLLFAACVIGSCVFTACNKKTHPSASTTESKTATETAAKPRAPKKTKVPVPKVIVVNDNVAQKTVDGRLYYDLNGKRYWKNNRDGKYYLFNKDMYNNPDFRAIKNG